MNYRFFDYKYNIPGFDSDLFCPAHITYIVLVYVLAFVLSYVFRKTRHERITALLKVQFVFMLLLEITKISWESYYDITTGRGFNFGGILPIYTCSLVMYTLPFAAWGKGRVKRTALAFLTTIGLLYGAIGVVYCNGLNFYPFWTFGAFYSLYFHSAMFATGVFLLMTGYHELKWADALWALIPILLLSAIAIPVNHYLHSDYMLIYSGGGVPLYEDLASSLAEKGLRWVYTVIMLVTHIPLAAVVIGIYKLIRAAEKK
ncbi:MAG: YwaF family protein, partial [Clostridia bacterium]|nr:YwaF family protein [Clostridia bacterium]